MTQLEDTNLQSFLIGDRQVGTGYPCLIIAEVAQMHDGSLGTAHAYIDAVAQAGVDAVKFQTHIAKAESTKEESWRIKFSPKDETRYEYWKRMEFTEKEWEGLATHAKERGLIFLSSAFSTQAVDLLEQLGTVAWKVGSGEIGSQDVIERMVATGKPVLLSSGMSSWQDLDRAARWVQQGNSPIGIFQCTSSYPCPPEKLGLNNIGLIRARYHCPVGFSDHSGTIYAGLAAATFGIEFLEIHVAFSRHCFGPDVGSSVTIEELNMLVTGIRFLETALTHPVDKETEAKENSAMRNLFAKSLVAVRNLQVGHTLKADDIVCKKPGTGIPSADLHMHVGRVLIHPVRKDALLSEDDLE